jgi:2-polyprenyl-3-methyl-5-hydroxy-6-metoxy-1,4-benzoquinol methylase
MMKHCSSDHSFDLKAQRRERKLDFYGTIQFINFIRHHAIKEKQTAEQIIGALGPLDDNSVFATMGKYMQPVLQDDAVLFAFEADDDEDAQQHTTADDSKHANMSVQDIVTNEDWQSTNDTEKLRAIVAMLLEQNEALTMEVKEMYTAKSRMQEAFMRVTNLDEKATDATKDTAPQLESSTSDTVADPTETKERAIIVASDKDYFSGYSGRDIHEEMLRDRVRTLAYRDAIQKNPALFKGKVVLDIGCGTGILSMFAAQAGAKHVISLDMADIIDRARVIVKENGLADKITLIKGKVEEIELPAEYPQVDIIISEWMGYFLVFESMLATVLYARDKWLKPLSEGSAVLPNLAVMYVSAIDSATWRDRSVDFWKDVYGFDMSTLIDESERYISTRVECVDSKHVASDVVELKRFDVPTMVDEDLDFTSTVTMTMARDTTLEGFVVHFDTDFSQHCEEPITLSTSPFEPSTHWAQTTFYLYKPVQAKQGDKIELFVRADRRIAHNPREYDILLRHKVSRGTEIIAEAEQMYSVRDAYSERD